MLYKRLEGKVAVVTGSGHGIGRCEAMSLAAAGASVVVSDFGSNSEGLKLAQLVANEITAAGNQAVAVTEDLMFAQGAQRTIEAALDSFGSLDILVNNAGMRGGNPIQKLTDEQWELVVGTHLKATFLMIRAAVPHLRARGGSIVNTGSEAGLGMIFNSAYAAAKEGVAGLTRSVAREQGRFGIRCNMIRPRATAGAVGGGDWFAKNLAGSWQPLVRALGRYWIGDRGDSRWEKKATPDSIAAFVTWLCSDAAKNVNGRDFFVGGDEIALVSSPVFTSMFRAEGWTVEALDELGPTLTASLSDPFRVPNPFSNDD